MLAKLTAAVAPIVFLAVAATPAPNEWQFFKSAALGALAGASARISLAVYQANVKAAVQGAWLAMASFWLGILTALGAYALGRINGHDPLMIAFYAGAGSLFGVLLEMLGGRWIRSRAKSITQEAN
jgi:hypothetical protein